MGGILDAVAKAAPEKGWGKDNGWNSRCRRESGSRLIDFLPLHPFVFNTIAVAIASNAGSLVYGQLRPQQQRLSIFHHLQQMRVVGWQACGVWEGARPSLHAHREEDREYRCEETQGHYSRVRGIVKDTR